MSNPVPEFDPASAVCVGRLLSPHGVQGDVKVHPLSDFPERFRPGAHLWLDGVPVRIERSRWQGRVVVLKLEGIDNREAVEARRDHGLFVPEPAKLREENVFYIHDIIGLTVSDQSGEELGRVSDVFATGSNDVYVVDGPMGQLLLPALDDVILSVDIEGGRMTVEVPPGLDFVPKGSGPKPRRAPQQKKPKKTAP